MNHIERSDTLNLMELTIDDLLVYTRIASCTCSCLRRLDHKIVSLVLTRSIQTKTYDQMTCRNIVLSVHCYKETGSIPNLSLMQFEVAPAKDFCTWCQGDLWKNQASICIVSCNHRFHLLSRDCLQYEDKGKRENKSIIEWVNKEQKCPNCMSRISPKSCHDQQPCLNQTKET
jgi:hypothetical protein